MSDAVSDAMPESRGRIGPARRDLAGVAVLTLAAAALCIYFELSEWLFVATRPWEHLQLDELVMVLVVLCASLAWFSWRRYRDAEAELARRRQAEERLASLLRDHRRLAQQYLQAQESERKLLARELHDELGQYLNAIKIDAVSIQAKAQSAPIQRASAAIVRHTDHVHAVVRDLIRKLRPAGLDDLGLKAALEQYVDDWRQRLPQVRFDASFEGEIDALAEPLALTIYRLLQEGITNVSRHAQARRVEISVRRTAAAAGTPDEAARNPDEVVFSMADDGRGASPGDKTAGLGLIGMRERVQSLGGRLEITTGPERGFAILARIPLLLAQRS